MKSLVKKIVRVFNQIRGLFSSPVPQGMTEFDKWVVSIMDTYDLPTKNKDDVAYTLANMVMHSGPSAHRVSKYTLVKMIRAAGAKQVAAGVFTEIRDRHQAAQKAAQKAAQEAANKPAEATAPLKVVSDGPKQPGV